MDATVSPEYALMQRRAALIEEARLAGLLDGEKSVRRALAPRRHVFERERFVRLAHDAQQGEAKIDAPALKVALEKRFGEALTEMSFARHVAKWKTGFALEADPSPLEDDCKIPGTK